jgi:hypothetical protein
MELAALVFTDVAVSLFLLIFGTVLLAWIANRWFKFPNASFKAHAFYWVITVLSYYLISALVTRLLGPVDSNFSPEEKLNVLDSMANIRIVLGLLTSVVLVKYIFQATWSESLKANLAFITLLAISLIVFGVLFVLFGVSMILGS